MWYSFEDKGYNLIPFEAVFIEAENNQEASDIFEQNFNDLPFERFSHGDKFWVEIAPTLEEASMPVRERIDGSFKDFKKFLSNHNYKIIQKTNTKEKQTI